MSSLWDKGQAVLDAIQTGDKNVAFKAFAEYAIAAKKIMDDAEQTIDALNAAIAAQTKEADRASKRRL